MITELTSEQQAQLVVYADKWRKIGLSTEPASRNAVEENILELYRLCEPDPPYLVWCDSPLHLSNIYNNRSLYPSLHWINQCVHDTLVGGAYNRIMDRIDNSLRKDIEYLFEFAFEGNVFDQIWDIVDELMDNPDLCYMSTIWYPFSNMGYLDYCNNILGISMPHIDTMQVIAQNVGWWLPCKRVCFIQERYNILKLDENEQPHCADGLAIGYPDGWGVYAWRGVRVPEHVILRPHEITFDEIMKQEDVSVASVMIERYGISRFIQQGGLNAIQSDDYRDLYRIEFDNQFKSITLVKTNNINPNGEQFIIIPSHIQTAKEAVEWDHKHNKHP